MPPQVFGRDLVHVVAGPPRFRAVAVETPVVVSVGAVIGAAHRRYSRVIVGHACVGLGGGRGVVCVTVIAEGALVPPLPGQVQ